MAQKTKQWGAIIVMIALFAMIAFVTNLCTPMATIIKNQGEISNVLAQIGNYGNFIAYLVMGINLSRQSLYLNLLLIQGIRNMIVHMLLKLIKAMNNNLMHIS